MRLNFCLFGREFGVILSSRKARKDPVQGVTNRCHDGKYVIFLDYDNVEESWVDAELLAIQEEYNLGDFHIIQSSKESYHAVCFDKVTRGDYEEILRRSSCDPHYKKVPFVWGKRLNTLRVSKKNGVGVRYKKTLIGYDNELDESTAHRDFFSKYYGFVVNKKVDDGVNDIIMATYRV